jgi:hypothetical protein
MFPLITLLFGFFTGILWIVLSLAPIYSSMDKINKEVRQVIKECEKTLPRDQHCEITATPKENP